MQIGLPIEYLWGALLSYSLSICFTATKMSLVYSFVVFFFFFALFTIKNTQQLFTAILVRVLERLEVNTCIQLAIFN